MGHGVDLLIMPWSIFFTWSFGRAKTNPIQNNSDSNVTKALVMLSSIIFFNLDIILFSVAS